MDLGDGVDHESYLLGNHDSARFLYKEMFRISSSQQSFESKYTLLKAAIREQHHHSWRALCDYLDASEEVNNGTVQDPLPPF